MSSDPQDIQARVRAALTEDGEDAQRELGVVSGVAGQYQPDQYAEAAKLGAKFGVPAKTVADNPEPYRKQSVREAVRSALSDAPATQAWMGNLDNAAVAQDDVENLAKLERSVGKVSGATRVADVARAFPGDLYKSFGMSTSGVGRLYGAGQRAFSGALDGGLRALGADSAADFLTAPRESLANLDPGRGLIAFGSQVERDAAIIGVPAERQNLATDIAGGLGQIAGQIAVALTGGSIPSTLSLLGQGADIQGDRAEAAGASQADTDKAVLVGSLVTAVTERYQLDRLLKAAPEGVRRTIVQKLTDVAMAGGSEALQEVVEGIGQNLTAKALYEPDAPIFEGLERDALAAGGAGAIAKAVLNAIVPGRARNQGRGDADAAAEISTILSESKLAQRSPEALEQLAAAIKERTGAEFAYVDPAAFRTLYQSDDEANAAANEFTGGQNAYTEAALAGTPIAIPLEKYVARLAPKVAELEVDAQPFTDFVSFDPDGMNGAEVEGSRETIEAQAKEIAEREMGEARPDASEAVYDDVVGQLLASGMERSTAEKNAKLMQSVFRTLGTRTGIDPKALYDRYALRIRRELPDVLGAVPQIDLALDPLLDRLRSGDVPSQADAFGPSMLEFIRSLGGLKDEGGELAARDVDKANKPFQRNVVQPGGRSLDDIAEVLVEAGYLTERDPNALLDLIDQELRGDPVFAFGNQKQDVIATREYLMQLQEELGRRGVDLKQTSNLEARRILSQRRFDQAAREQTQTDAFKQWFGDSKVVDAKGKPLVLYHGTRQDFEAFDPATQGAATEAASAGKGFFFSNRAITADSYTNLVLPQEKEAHDALFDEGAKLRKSWMRSSSRDPKKRAAALAKAAAGERLMREAAVMRQQGGNVMPVFLSLQNPMIHDMKGKHYRDQSYSDLIDQAIAAGHDGLIIKNTYDAVLGDGIADDVYVAFKPEQIKSALGNRGTFDPASLNVLEQRGANDAKRGAITFGADRQFTVSLFEKADLSTFLHESGHFYLEIMGDLAEDASAPQRIKDDYQTLLKWLGVKGRAGIATEQHEQFARGFEAYLLEGKSPSAELATVFDRFRAWLIGVYRTIARLNVTLNDDVRRVMDRIVATDEQIKEAEQSQGYAPVFLNAEAAGMPPTEWEAYRGVVDRAHRESVNELTGRAMTELARERQAWWKEEHAKVRVEVATEVDALPAYRALDILKTGKLPDGSALPAKLSRSDLTARYGKEFAKRLPRKTVDKTGGLSADVMAQLLGFTDADTLVKAIVTARPRKELIKAETDARMRERYGDMLTDGTLVEEAITAVHTEARAKVLAAELKALKRKRGEVKPFVDAALEARKQQQRDARDANYGNLLSKAEIAALREQAALQIALNPDVDAAGYAKLADRASKKAFDFASVGKFEDAAGQRRLEVLNRELHYAALEAQEKAQAAAARKKVSDQRAARDANAATLPDREELQALRLAATRAISAKKIRDIQPALYRRAEAQAARAAFEAAGKGDFEIAYSEQRRRIYNYELFRAAVAARETIQKNVDYMRRFDKKSVREKLAAAKGQYLQQIDALRARFDFSNRPAKEDLKRDKLTKWVEEQTAAGREVTIPQWVIDEARTTPYKELTAIELDGLTDAAKNIEHLARTKDRLLRNRKEADFQSAKAELEPRARTSLKGGKAPPVSQFEMSQVRKFGQWILDFGDSLVRTESYIEWLDGGESGPWHDFFMEPANNAEYARESLRTQILEPMRKLADGIDRARRAELKEPIRIEALKQSFDRRTLISVALNMGNESNLERLLEGGFRDPTRGNRISKFTPAALEEIKRKLNAKDWQFIQEAWNTAELLWPSMKAFQERMGGLVPEKIPATPVVTPHGTFAGGYWPVVYDALASKPGSKQADSADALGILMGASFSGASTSKSALKARVGVGGPLKLDFSAVMGRHLDQVITDITHREFAIQAMRILEDPDLRLAVQDGIGEVGWASMKAMVAATINQDGGFADISNRGTEMMGQRIISQLAVAALGFKVMTAFGNLVLAPIQAAARVNPVHMLKGIAQFMRHPVQARAFVDASSEMMRNRAQNMDNSFSALREKLEGRTSIIAKTQRAAMSIHQAADYIGTTGIWLGRYSEALAAGADQAEAVRLADKAIRTTQTAGAPKDLSAFERNPANKWFKLFIGPMIIMNNRMREAVRKKGAVQTWPEAFGVLVATWFLPAILWDIVNGRGPDDDDDDDEVLTDEFLPWALRKVLAYPFMTLPLFRDAVGLAERKASGQYAEAKMNPVSDAAWLLYVAGETVAKQTSEADSDDEDDAGKITKAALRAVGPLTGMPTGQLDVTGSFIWDVFSGEYEPEGAADLRYLLMRRPKED